MVFFVAFHHKGIEGVVDTVQGIEVAEGNEENEVNDSSDDSVKGIHFSDSEEERDLGLDDGFDLPDVGEADAILNGVDVERLAATFIPPYLNSMHEMEVEYNTEELDNELDDDNIDGVNDKLRVRVECSRNCDFTMLVSKVGDNNTYRMKTLIRPHTCGRIFDNKNANSNRVTKILVDKFRNASSLTVSEIIDDVRKNYSVVEGNLREVEGNLGAGGANLGAVETTVNPSDSGGDAKE
ncbi:hypothetical protein SESBI_19830 [Sesbania bispinosa]|nr:hypothetical protein SESBI_19830 [Sesbania bispinosa]